MKKFRRRKVFGRSVEGFYFVQIMSYENRKIFRDSDDRLTKSGEMIKYWVGALDNRSNDLRVDKFLIGDYFLKMIIEIKSSSLNDVDFYKPYRKSSLSLPRCIIWFKTETARAYLNYAEDWKNINVWLWEKEFTSVKIEKERDVEFLRKELEGLK